MGHCIQSIYTHVPEAKLANTAFTIIAILIVKEYHIRRVITSAFHAISRSFPIARLLVRV